MPQSSNPTLRDSIFENHGTSTQATMTVNGTAIKTAFLASLAFVSALFTFNLDSNLIAIASSTSLATLLLVYIICANPGERAPLYAIPYAIIEGLSLGAISALMDARAVERGYSGIVAQALIITFAILGTMLVGYATGLIRARPWLEKVIMVSIFGIVATYLLHFVLVIFGLSIPFIHSSGPVGLAFGFFVVGIASFSLVTDFDFIETMTEVGASKKMEWFGAVAIMVTLVWLYVEILHLLYKIKGRN
jgi:uncharacterized YccA/Bax inhibitor family protein